jgi:hypothetical protein
MIVVRAFDPYGLAAGSVAGILIVILSPEIRMGVWRRYCFMASEATIISAGYDQLGSLSK